MKDNTKETTNASEIFEKFKAAGVNLQTTVDRASKEEKIKCSAYNLKQIISVCFSGVYARNTMGVRLDMLKAPIYENNENGIEYPREVNDVDVTRVIEWISEVFQCDFSPLQVQAALWSEAERNPYNQAREWLETLPEWDRVNRICYISQWLKVSKEAESATNMAFMQFLLGLIGAAYATKENTVKPQTVFILQGEQGTGKSRFFRSLFPKKNRSEWLHEKPWCSEGGEASERYNRSMVNCWLDVDSECEQMVRSSTQSLKSWTTTDVESFRPLYRSQIRVARWFSLAGCTNQEQILRDETGARRWNVIRSQATETDPIDVDSVEKYRDLLWSEAFFFFKHNCEGSVEKLNDALWSNAKVWGSEVLTEYKNYFENVRRESYQEDVLEPAVMSYLEENSDRARHNEMDNPITVSDIILSLDGNRSAGDLGALARSGVQGVAIRIEKILTRCGLKKGRGPQSKGKTGWRRPARAK